MGGWRWGVGGSSNEDSWELSSSQDSQRKEQACLPGNQEQTFTCRLTLPHTHDYRGQV